MPRSALEPVLGALVEPGAHGVAAYLGRGQTVYGNTDTAGPTFGQLVAVGTAPSAIPAFANVDPPRMFQLQARFIF